MARAAACELVQGTTRIIFEYVRTRGVLRLTGNPGTHTQWGPMEVAFDDLVRLLRVDVSGLVPDQPFLVFAGNGSNGGSKDFVAAFSTEAEARERFVELRQGTATWAEVVTLTKGNLRQLCWFGSPDASTPPLRRWRR